ncbi:PQQ-dependent sugar dehydrogenase [Microbacterium sp. CJ88]|uniref:PQQ-dependent sugar dehydrogenase n=1 Tax=Microbacterium sp. CJ88 TaxID=3445672 RepID=UPI003F65B546
MISSSPDRRLAGAVAVIGAVASVLMMTACTAGAPSDAVPAETRRAPSVTVSAPPVGGAFALDGAPVTLASALEAPWSVVPLPEGGALISQRDDGRVRHLLPDGTVRDAGTVPGVVSGGESGLHGLALHEASGVRWLYAYHGAADDNRVVRMPLTGENSTLALGAPDVVFSGIARARTHNGGRIAFGPDGFLYVTTGDAGDRASAQDEASVNGKILRLTAEGAPAPGNPFGTAVWSLGHRNVQGLAWTASGTLWASEFGQDTWDELNVIRAGGNYGWPEVEGAAADARFVDPVAVWTPTDASPSGVAAVGDTVFVTGLRGERLWIVDTSGASLRADPRAALVGEQGRLRDAVAAPDGSLWLLTGNTDGRGAPRPGDDVLLRIGLSPTP